MKKIRVLSALSIAACLSLGAAPASADILGAAQFLGSMGAGAPLDGSAGSMLGAAAAAGLADGDSGSITSAAPAAETELDAGVSEDKEAQRAQSPRAARSAGRFSAPSASMREEIREAAALRQAQPATVEFNPMSQGFSRWFTVGAFGLLASLFLGVFVCALVSFSRSERESRARERQNEEDRARLFGSR